MILTRATHKQMHDIALALSIFNVILADWGYMPMDTLSYCLIVNAVYVLSYWVRVIFFKEQV